MGWIALWMTVGCGGDEMTDGGCTYDDLPGTCTFTQVQAGADLTFTYASEDGATTDDGMVSIGDGGTPPDQACLDALGVAADQQVECVQRTITSGTCTPTVWDFPSLDLDVCL